MRLLEFAQGPLLVISLVVLAAGTLLRLYGIFRLPARADLATPRRRTGVGDALRGIHARVVPRREFRARIAFSEANAWLFHVGLLVVVAAYAPHIDFVRHLIGLHWPALPDAVTYFAGALTLVSLLVALLYRLSHPVLRLISNADDYLSWLLTLAAVATGMMAFEYDAGRTEALVAAHLLSVEALLIWLPFGKLAHAFLVFVSRGMTGMAFARKGAKL